LVVDITHELLLFCVIDEMSPNFTQIIVNLPLNQ